MPVPGCDVGHSFLVTLCRGHTWFSRNGNGAAHWLLSENIAGWSRRKGGSTARLPWDMLGFSGPKLQEGELVQGCLSVCLPHFRERKGKNLHGVGQCLGSVCPLASSCPLPNSNLHGAGERGQPWTSLEPERDSAVGNGSLLQRFHCGADSPLGRCIIYGQVQSYREFCRRVPLAGPSVAGWSQGHQYISIPTLHGGWLPRVPLGISGPTTPSAWKCHDGSWGNILAS